MSGATRSSRLAGSISVTPAPSGNPQTLAGIPITKPTGLRRWRAALAAAKFGEAPICCGVDSHTFGQFADGTNNTDATANLTNAVRGYVGQLRSLFAQTYGDPGEGFLMPNYSAEGRITQGAGVATNAPHPAVLRRHAYLSPGGYPNATLTYTVPAGVFFLGLILENTAGLTSPTWTKDGAIQGAWTTLDNTGGMNFTYHGVAPGQVVVIKGDNTTSANVIGLVARTARVGVPVHRMGVGGITQSEMLGGSFNGVLATVDGSTIWTAPQQQAYVRAHYKWEPSKGVVIIMAGTNEQSLQLGSAGYGNGITPAIYAQGLTTTVQQIAADGWCTLLVGPCPSGSENVTAGAAPLTSYKAQMQAVATANDHCSYIDIADAWGLSAAAAYAAGLRDQTSSHPTYKGYGDEARLIHRVLTLPAIGS